MQWLFVPAAYDPLSCMKNKDADATNPNLYHCIDDETKLDHVYDEIKHKEGYGNTYKNIIWNRIQTKQFLTFDDQILLNFSLPFIYVIFMWFPTSIESNKNPIHALLNLQTNWRKHSLHTTAYLVLEFNDQNLAKRTVVSFFLFPFYRNGVRSFELHSTSKQMEAALSKNA